MDKNIRLQPLMNVCSNSILGYEALSAKKMNGLYPSAFEMLGDIASDILIEDESRFFINMTPDEVVNENFSKDFLKQLDDLRIDGNRVTIEINESSDPNMITEIRATLKALRLYDIKIALDDLGTGNATLDFMRQLPLDVVKIDKKFVQSAPNSEKDEAILNFFVDASHDFGCSVVAEGIETEKQLKLAKRARADIGQGFLFTVQSRVWHDTFTAIPESPFIQLSDFSTYVSSSRSNYQFQSKQFLSLY